MTETTSGVIAVPPGLRAPVDAASGTLSIGVPLPGIDAQVVDADDTPVAPGEQVRTVDVDGWSVGLATCYDVRFADQFTQLGRRGAELVVFPEATMCRFGVPLKPVAEDLDGPWARGVSEVASARTRARSDSSARVRACCASR